MTKPFHINVPTGLDFQPNLEDLLNVDQIRTIRQCMLGLTNPIGDTTSQENSLLAAWPLHEETESHTYADSLAGLNRANNSDNDQLTAYKMLVFAGLASSRPINVVITRLAAARTALRLEPFHSMLVSEGVARRTGMIPAYPEALSATQKLAILSLAFRMLQTDAGRHIKEMAIFRVIMMTLDAQDVTSDALQSGLKRTTSDLCHAIGDDGALTAVLAMLRMATADLQIRLSEQHILRQLAKATDCKKTELDKLFAFVQLETGVVLPPFDWSI